MGPPVFVLDQAQLIASANEYPGIAAIVGDWLAEFALGRCLRGSDRRHRHKRKAGKRCSQLVTDIPTIPWVAGTVTCRVGREDDTFRAHLVLRTASKVRSVYTNLEQRPAYRALRA